MTLVSEGIFDFLIFVFVIFRFCDFRFFDFDFLIFDFRFLIKCVMYQVHGVDPGSTFNILMFIIARNLWNLRSSFELG